jgi:hypothetical protein
MTPIKNIVSDIASSERLKQQERVSPTRTDKTKKQEQPTREGAAVEPRKDTVDISTTARELAETRGNDVARYQEVLAALRNNESEKMQVARQRIAEGAYNEPAVLERVADAIVTLPQFRSLAPSAPEPGSREVQGDVAARIRSGEYDTEEVLDKVAMNILRDMGAA